MRLIDNIIRYFNKSGVFQYIIKIIFAFSLPVGILYYFPFLVPAIVPEEYIMIIYSIADSVYVHINPFTTGSYIAGILCLLVFLFYRTKVYKLFVFLMYLISIAISMVSVFGMTEIWEAWIYIPHIIIIIFIIIEMVRRYKVNREKTVKRVK